MGKVKKDNKNTHDLCSTFKEHKFIFDNLNDIIWSMSWPDFKVKFVSKAVEDVIGYSIEEFKNDPLLLQKITHNEDKEINNKALYDLEKKGFSERKIRLISKNGEIKWVHDKAKMVYDKDNNPIRVEGVMRDITSRKKIKKQLKLNKKRYQTIFNSVPIGILIEDENGKILEVNDVLCKEFGYSKKELEGASVLEKFVLPEDRDLAKENIKKILKGQDLEFDIKTQIKNGNIKYFHLKETNINLPKGKKGIISMHIDITKRVKKEKEIKHLAYKDSLTGLYNRKFFESELKSINKKNKLPISIIIGDLNGLKIINDSYGQKKGDEILRKTANLLKNIVSKNDILARYGGDEFAIIFPKTDYKKCQKKIKKIKEISKNYFGEKIPISISFGIATKSQKGQEISEIIKKAENKMYQSKLSERKSGKNNIVQALLNTLSAKSSETKEHAVRMAELAMEFGKKLDLPNFELTRLSLLATLHDIGKTTISEEILKKTDKLTNAEWEMIKKHPQIGYKIASASEEFTIVADEILTHHERWDGSGYPDGLKGEKIPYLSRIISIIDAYDVMTHDRPYSKAISKKEALEEIRTCAGSQFDPKLVKEFLEMKNYNSDNKKYKYNLN
ncbi:MAG: sensor domain-containing diguanylate cyclase/phosphohydrolase [Bacillota bacterium]